MIRNDGSYRIYLIQARHPKTYRNGEWFEVSFDYFGSPKGFTASDECWQKTGVYGTFDEKVAQAGLKWIKEKHPHTKFRLVRADIMQMKTPVS